MKPNFRHLARSRLERAQSLLANREESNVVYAALELRMAMEALIYSSAEAYRRELPADGCKTWQPRKLLELLLETDPYCDRDATIAVGLEEVPGVPSSEMRVIGTDVKLNLKTVKSYYDALGSYLHTPTMDQIAKGKGHDISKLRSKCSELANQIESVLQSAVFNCTMGHLTETECAGCGAVVRKRVTYLLVGEAIDARCFSCDLQYIVKREAENTFIWQEKTAKINCIYEDCGVEMHLRSEAVKPNTVVNCPACHRKMRLALSIFRHA